MAIRFPLRAIAASVALATALAGAIVLCAPPASAAAGAPHQGRGYTVGGGDFVGFYVTPDGATVYCLSPRKALPASIGLDQVPKYPGVSRTTSRRLAYALGRWGEAHSRHAAAAESQLLNTIVGNNADVARRGSQLPRSVTALVHSHLRATEHFHGPYATTVDLPHALLPGQSATGTVVVRSATGHRVRHLAITLSSSPNASVPAHVTTDGKGRAHFTYTATDTGEVHVDATALGLPAEQLMVNQPSESEQHMVGRVQATTSHGSASFRRSPKGFSNSYACTTTCDGRPATTLRACTPASSYPSRITYHYGSKHVRVRFPAAGARTCKQVEVVTRDGDHVWARWQFKTRHGWTKPIKADGAFDVDCPAAPPVGVSMSYDCSDATVTIALADQGAHGTWTPLVNSTEHTMVLVIGGAANKRIYAVHGDRAVFRTTASCDSPVTYTARGGVQRDNGDYNYGAVASITTPGPA